MGKKKEKFKNNFSHFFLFLFEVLSLELQFSMQSLWVKRFLFYSNRTLNTPTNK